MNDLTNKWNDEEKLLYLSALSYILSTRDSNERSKAFMKLKARELDILPTRIKKITSAQKLIAVLAPIPSIKTRRFILRDMILLSIADHDLNDQEISLIYEVGTGIGLKAEKIDDFFLWAAGGLEWQIEGSRLVEEDI